MEFGKDGLIINGSQVNGYFEVLLANGEDRATFRVGNGVNDADAVNLGQLNLKLDANKVVTDIDAASGYIADAPTVKAAIAAQVTSLINSAPAAYDTLGEIATWVESHQDLYEALLTTVGNKLDASKVTTDINATAGNVPDAPTVKNYIDTEIGAVSFSADQITASDAGRTHITGATVDAQLDDVDSTIASMTAGISSLSTGMATTVGKSPNGNYLPNFTGSTIPDQSTVFGALQSLETSLEAISGMDTCRTVNFDFNSASEVNIGSVIPAGSTIDRVKIRCKTPFNDMAAYATVGITGDTDAYATVGDINLRSNTVSLVEHLDDPLASDTQLKLFLNKGTSTAGAGIVLVYFC
ncbi:MAG: hypothetical protein ACRCXT_12070 [Paraclostridium sp.]